MSNKLPLYPSGTNNSILPYAPLSERDKLVAWVHEMYERGRKPIPALLVQADAFHRSRSSLLSEVVIACRPGDHSQALEEAKTKFMRDYKTWNRGKK